MVNSTRKGKVKSYQGAATLIIAVVFIMLSTLIIIFAARNGLMHSKISANTARNSQAYEAAEAGLEYGINYLDQNSATIIASPTNGFINFTNANTTNVALSNGSKFSIVYTNPTVNDYTMIQITSTGQSDDNSSTRSVSQVVKRSSIIANTGTHALTSKSNINITGNGSISNLTSSQTVASGGTVAFGGNGSTYTSGGQQSDAGGILADVTQNVGALSSATTNDFFASYFGTTSTSAVRSQANYSYSSNSSANYSSTLNGIQGAMIWIDANNGSTASLSGNTVIGSASNPVLLIVNGSFSISGNVTVYGMVFVLGDSGLTTLTGNNNIIGTIVSTETMNISGNTFVSYDQSVLDNLKNSASMTTWAKVSGSWKDY